MPKKLVECVKKLKQQGKPEKQAWPICINSTGLKPHKKKQKKGKNMKKSDTFVNNLISKPLDLDQHIRSKLHPDALKFIALLKYYTKDLNLNDPQQIKIKDYTVIIHKVEPGIYSGHLLDPANEIIMEFKEQSIPIIGSMLAAKLDNLLDNKLEKPEEELDTPDELQVTNINPDKPKNINISVRPDGEININIQKSKERTMSDMLEKLYKDIIEDKKIEKSKKSRLHRMWKVFNIDAPEKVETFEDIMKACDGMSKIYNKVKEQGKTEQEASFIALMAGKDKYNTDLITKAYVGFKKVEDAARKRGAKDPKAIASKVMWDKYGSMASHPLRKIKKGGPGSGRKPTGQKKEKQIHISHGGRHGVATPSAFGDGWVAKIHTNRGYSNFHEAKNSEPKNVQTLSHVDPESKKESSLHPSKEHALSRIKEVLERYAGTPMKKSTMLDQFTPDESIQPKNAKEMHELRKADIDAKFNSKQFNEKEDHPLEIKKSDNMAQRIEKLNKSNDNFGQEELNKSFTDRVWNRKQVNYCDADTRTDAEKYWENIEKAKYIKREGSPGKYKYTYAEDKKKDRSSKKEEPKKNKTEKKINNITELKDRYSYQENTKNWSQKEHEDAHNAYSEMAYEMGPDNPVSDAYFYLSVYHYWMAQNNSKKANNTLDDYQSAYKKLGRIEKAKYIKREGSPGKYKYTYAEDKKEKPGKKEFKPSFGKPYGSGIKSGKIITWTKEGDPMHESEFRSKLHEYHHKKEGLEYALAGESAREYPIKWHGSGVFSHGDEQYKLKQDGKIEKLSEKEKKERTKQAKKTEKEADTFIRKLKEREKKVKEKREKK